MEEVAEDKIFDRINRMDRILSARLRRENNPVKREVLTYDVVGCVYKSPRSGCVFQAALPERPDAVDPSNPVNPVR